MIENQNFSNKSTRLMWIPRMEECHIPVKEMLTTGHRGPKGYASYNAIHWEKDNKVIQRIISQTIAVDSSG